jgi:hypothetical protein
LRIARAAAPAAHERFAVAVLACALASALLAGCGIDLAETPPPSGPIPTPLVSAPADLASVRAALDQSLRAAAGVGLDDAPEGYRPAEPAAFTYVPRAVAKVRLPNDPNRLYVVFYGFPSDTAAATAARTAAAFYASGPGMVQFPADTQFAIPRSGDVLVFAAWSPGTTSDQAAAAAAFAAIKAFGEPAG